MSVPLVKRIFAFFDTVWSFILTLVRSLLALFSFRRRASDPLALPSVSRTPKDALVRAHSHLRPILLTPRSIARSPAYYTQRAESTRTRSATSTIVPGHNETSAASESASGSQTSDPQRTSPKLDPSDPELGLPAATSLAADHVGPPGTSAMSFRGGTPDTSLPTSLSVLPLTPPDRCYLAPTPSVTDCPYAEPWPTGGALGRDKPRLPGSSLKVSVNTDSEFVPMGSPSPERWSPVRIWTSTPYKDDRPAVPDLALSPSDNHTRSTVDPSPALANISHALISRSRNSMRPYDDASSSGTTSDASPSADYSPVTLQRPDPIHKGHQAHALKYKPYPQFHFPNAYACTWRRHGVRVPGRPSATAQRYTYARSRSHTDLPASEWYDANAFLPSSPCALSPPPCESATEDEDEDQLPLSRLRERLARRSAAAGPNVGLGVPGMGTRKAAAMSPRARTRTMSEGCLLAFSESTPTRVGMGERAGRQALSMAFDGDGYSPKDWLEALSLHFPDEQKGASAPIYHLPK